MLDDFVPNPPDLGDRPLEIGRQRFSQRIELDAKRMQIDLRRLRCGRHPQKSDRRSCDSGTRGAA